LRPQHARRQLLKETRLSGFESLPPSQSRAIVAVSSGIRTAADTLTIVPVLHVARDVAHILGDIGRRRIAITGG